MKKFCVVLLLALCFVFANSFLADANNSNNVKKLIESAEAGDSRAQFWLGAYHELGEKGFPQDYQKAKYWYEKSAAQGNSDAQSQLAFLYYSGLGTQQNYKKAKKWYHKAALQNDAYAQYMLGIFYINGLDTKQNYTTAKEWFEKSALQGNIDSEVQLAHLYRGGFGVSKNYLKSKILL